ncbi:hypothetical protein V5O48_006509 [Marasmius crinis-equi]|uniref:Uncharacterized protein n=1 Tax=Marasmius crinis-equi TaxID=585013 RepID=A0ABR3FJH1_9AGAR
MEEFLDIDKILDSNDTLHRESEFLVSSEADYDSLPDNTTEIVWCLEARENDIDFRIMVFGWTKNGV